MVFQHRVDDRADVGGDRQVGPRVELICRQSAPATRDPPTGYRTTHQERYAGTTMVGAALFVEVG